MDQTEYERRLESVSARALRLDDVEKLRILHRGYVTSLAQRDWTTMLEYFTVDALVSIRDHAVRRGAQELAELFGAMRGAGAPPDGYLTTSPVITIIGDEASAAWTWHRLFTEMPVMGGVLRIAGPWWEGRYRCEYRRVQECWKIAELHFRLVAPDRDADASAVLTPAAFEGASA